MKRNQIAASLFSEESKKRRNLSTLASPVKISPEITQWYIHVINNIINKNNELRNNINIIHPAAFAKLNTHLYKSLMLLPANYFNNYSALRMLDQFERRLKIAISRLGENDQLDYFHLTRILIPCITTAAKIEEEKSIWNVDFIDEEGQDKDRIAFAYSFIAILSDLKSNSSDFESETPHSKVLNELEREHFAILKFQVDLPIKTTESNNRVLELLESISHSNMTLSIQSDLVLQQLEKDHTMDYLSQFFKNLKNFALEISDVIKTDQDSHLSAKLLELIQLCKNAETTFANLLKNIILTNKKILSNDEIENILNEACAIVTHCKVEMSNMITDILMQYKSVNSSISTDFRLFSNQSSSTAFHLLTEFAKTNNIIILTDVDIKIASPSFSSSQRLA